MKRIPQSTNKFKHDYDQLFAGIDAGSVSLNCVVINQSKEIIFNLPYERHMGKVTEAVSTLIKLLYNKFGEDVIKAIAFTGNHGKKFAEIFGTFYEFETICQVLGSLHLYPLAKTIISMGGQDTALFQIDHSSGAWELEYFDVNGPCASGTGSFIDQQAQRLATSIYTSDYSFTKNHIDKILFDFIQLGLESKKPANVACRCTVFTKSDMIHLQNKGEDLKDIIYGLHVGNARNYLSTMVANRQLKEPILFIGGLSLNELQVRVFKDHFPQLMVPSCNTSLGALGAVLQALEMEQETLVDIRQLDLALDINSHIPTAPRLQLLKTSFPVVKEIQTQTIRKRTPVYLGVDIGSTTTKCVLINSSRKIIYKNYLHTKGKPIEVTQNILSSILEKTGARIEIMGVATTGSGRNVVGDFLNVDLIIDEISAHARGAVEIAPEVETIFEIGGQDSKYINIVNGYPLDFDMNKVCAAGTGSFLHELANKYGINIVTEFQEIALSSAAPVKLAERCTVFMESDLVSYHQQGASRNDLMAGLCYAIVHNYLNRVVGKRYIGKKVMFLGGPSLNKGVVAAFENVLGQGLLIPAHREVLGAYGAAVSAQEAISFKARPKSSFRGLLSAINDRMSYKEKVCHVDRNCHNQCKLKVYNFDGRHSIWGGECGRYELTRSVVSPKKNFFDLRQRIWKKYMDGVCLELTKEPLMEVDSRPTVGMQNALTGHQTSIFWAHFFDILGYRLVLTPPTNRYLSMLGVESMLAETCYPVKVSHGHVKALKGKTKFIFLPVIINMETVDPGETGFYCPMVQGNTYMVQTALDLDPSSILSPVIHFKYDHATLAVELYEQFKHKLSVSRKGIKKAISYAYEKDLQFRQELHELGREALQNQGLDEPVLLVSGRSYNLYDEKLNLGIGQNLAKIGLTALPMDFINLNEVDLADFPSMYWGMGAQILRTAKFINQYPNYFGIHLTNFSCGPDSFIEHFYKHIMGDRPYLILELDEHSGVAGIMTRIEAFKNVIQNVPHKLVRDPKLNLKLANI